MIKKTALFLGIFALGVVTGALILYFVVGRGAARIYANALEAQADAALKVSSGEQERFLRDFERNLPGDVEAVRSFGDYDFVRSYLRKVGAYYEGTGTPIPESIAAAIATLPAEGTRTNNHPVSSRHKAERLKIENEVGR